MRKLIIVTFLLGFCLALLVSFPSTESYVKPEPLPVEDPKPVPKPIKKKTYNKLAEVRQPTESERVHIERIFGSDAKVATAVLRHESGLNARAKNWNCHYYREDGTRYSTSCKKADRELAWSVDCGIAQINVKGKECPEELFTLEGSMREVEKRYKAQGLNAWSSYKNKKYLKYM